MNFPNFPLYKSLYPNEFKELDEQQKDILLYNIKDMNDEKQSIVYALIRAYHMNHDMHIQDLPYGGKSLKNGLKFDIDTLPSKLQYMLFQFSTIDKMAPIQSFQSKKRLFILKNVDISATNLKYGIMTDVQYKFTEDISKTTKICDILTDVNDNVFSFLDENKKKYNVTVTMVDFINKDILPLHTNIKCFWCKHSFETKPIGCPIKYVNSLVEKSYLSHITKDRYYMKENVTPTKLESIQKIEHDNETMQIMPLLKNYYLTDGVFCSFNCMIAFIKDNKHDLFYKESYSLAHGMYYDFFGKKIQLKSAPHWRILNDFGGMKSIDDFRKSFDIASYDFMFTIRDSRSIANVYKETIHNV